MKIIAIASPAGGVGKTTLAHAIAVAAAEFGKKTLLVDLDPASALTFRLGFENPRLTITDYLTGSKLVEENLSATSERFDFIAADSRLTSNLDEGSLAKFMTELPKEYDLVILDNAPSLSLPLKLALTVADHIFTPVDSSLHSLRGLMQLRALTEIPVTAVATGIVEADVIAPVLDVTLSKSNEIDEFILGTVSVLTGAKNSDIAEMYRSATYSILEILGME
jgi:cellulose biosynthesis protein BcsQ